MLNRLREIRRWHVERRLLPLLVRPEAGELGTVRVADALLPDGLIAPDWICYCAGVGEDIRIERFLAEQIGAAVWAFDPTPRSIRYMATADYDRTRLHFVPVGLWREDTTLRFHAPENPAHVSHSVMGRLGGDGHFDAPCRTVRSLMRELGHTRVDLLKMNIEGAETAVLGAVLADGARPRVIAMTYEGRGALRQVRAWTLRLRAEGYRLLGREGWFFTYVRS